MNRKKTIEARLVTLAVWLLLAAPVSAHTRSQSFSSWHLRNGEVRMSFSVQALEVTRLGLVADATLSLSDLLVQHLRSSIAVRVAGEPCLSATGPLSRVAREGYLRVEWRFTCPATGPVEITSEAFFMVAPSHIHYARVRVGEQSPVEYLFTDVERRRVIETDHEGELAASYGTSFAAYVLLGVQHILIGVDHLAFLLALLLLSRRAREVFLMISGFTVGHSGTLSLAVLGVVQPNVPVIEALIGFTIALVAAENVGVTTGANSTIAIVAGIACTVLAFMNVLGHVGLPWVTMIGLALFTFCYMLLANTQERAARLRPLLTILFGLIHGFGFASVLMEIGIPNGRLIPALLGFNLGVEVGQLGIVLTLWAGNIVVIRYFPKTNHRFATDLLSAALCALGLFWFIGRALAIS